MKKTKSIVTRNAGELIAALGLPAEEAVELEFRRQLNHKIIQVVNNRKLTHEQAAQLARTSRTRLTAILNGNTRNVSTDLMLRILAALGYSINITFHRSRSAA